MKRIPNPTDTTYEREFWNNLRHHKNFDISADMAKVPRTGAYMLPAEQASRYTDELTNETFFRRLGTVMPMYDNDYAVKTTTGEAEPEWVPENGNIPEDETLMETHDFKVHKLGCIAKIHTDLLADHGFDFENWLLVKFAQRFAHAEINAFVNGTGSGQPVGILSEYGGADIGTETSVITYDDMISLFHSLDPKFREKAVWVMNDTTAIALRKLKDADGNHLWSPSSDKLLGKEVIICNAMPDIESGKKPIALGDFSYYWIMERAPFCVRSLSEKYLMQQMNGYVGYEFLDAKLIRADAIKTLKITETE